MAMNDINCLIFFLIDYDGNKLEARFGHYFEVLSFVEISMFG